MMSEIDKIKNHSSRREMIDFLEDTEVDLDSAVLLYREPSGEYGFRKLDGSSNLMLIGMLRSTTKLFERIEVDGLEEDMEDEEAEDA